jgi:hypothetical protein
LTGTVEDIEAEDLITGRIDFAFRTSGQSFSLLNGLVCDDGDVTSDAYTCSGDTLRFSLELEQVQYRRR